MWRGLVAKGAIAVAMKNEPFWSSFSIVVFFLRSSCSRGELLNFWGLMFARSRREWKRSRTLRKWWPDENECERRERTIVFSHVVVVFAAISNPFLSLIPPHPSSYFFPFLQTQSLACSSSSLVVSHYWVWGKWLRLVPTRLTGTRNDRRRKTQRKG